VSLCETIRAPKHRRQTMIRINENYAKLQASYLFSEIARRV